MKHDTHHQVRVDSMLDEIGALRALLRRIETIAGESKPSRGQDDLLSRMGAIGDLAYRPRHPSWPRTKRTL